MEALAAHLTRERQRKVYLVPVGGSNAVGVWGYLQARTCSLREWNCRRLTSPRAQAFQELMDQGATSDFDELVVATGSGGTLAGLAIGNYLAGSPVKVTAYAVCDDAAYFHGCGAGVWRPDFFRPA
jgi:D-cysteine desulfhydrase